MFRHVSKWVFLQVYIIPKTEQHESKGANGACMENAIYIIVLDVTPSILLPHSLSLYLVLLKLNNLVAKQHPIIAQFTTTLHLFQIEVSIVQSTFNLVFEMNFIVW